MWRAGLLALAAGLALGACSMVRVAYDNAPRMLLGEMDTYLALDERQREQALGLLETRMARHRRVELPRYVALLGEAERTLADGATRAEIEMLRDRIVELYREAMAETIPALVPVLSGLDAEQIDHLAARLEERNRELAEKYAADAPAERMQRRRERAVARIERWTGPLRPAQVSLIEKRRDAMPFIAKDWLAYHRANQQRLLAMLRARAPRGEIAAFLDAWWVRLADRPPALARKLAASDAAWVALLVVLDGTLDEQQRQHVLARLESYREGLAPLLARGIAPAPAGAPAAAGGSEIRAWSAGA